MVLPLSILLFRGLAVRLFHKSNPDDCRHALSMYRKFKNSFLGCAISRNLGIWFEGAGDRMTCRQTEGSRRDRLREPFCFCRVLQYSRTVIPATWTTKRFAYEQI